jgi:hypothetical protein
MSYRTDDDLLKSASMKAAAIRRIVKEQKLAISLSGREYVKVDGWVMLAAMVGLAPTVIGTEAKPDGRYCAVAELRTHFGQAMSRADAECGGESEPNWQKRPDYARRSMAQTRAVGKACRVLLSWVMVLAGYAPTPAEEMDGVREEVEQEAGPDRKLAECIRAMRRNAESIAAIVHGLESGEHEGLRDAATAWFELDAEDKKALWIAPSKGGLFTVGERELLKSSEFRELYYGRTEEDSSQEAEATADS